MSLSLSLSLYPHTLSPPPRRVASGSGIAYGHTLCAVLAYVLDRMRLRGARVECYAVLSQGMGEQDGKIDYREFAK
eukprot:1594635-Rhodomonas_salina.1